MLIWKPPALLILGIGFAVGALVTFLGTMVLGWLTTDDSAKAVALVVWGVLALAGDLQWRRKNDLALFDLSASTLFFVLPTWAVAGALLIGGVVTAL